MPLKGYISLCEDHAPIIVSRDHGNPQTHIARNRDRNSFVTHYKIDNVVIKTGNKCDYLLINEDTSTAYLIELKGSDLGWAAMQLEETEKKLRSQLAQYNTIQYRIVANKCKTHEINSTSFNKYKVKWKSRLKYSSVKLEEDI